MIGILIIVKKNGFSLAEMMVVMLIISIMMAAATPILTKRAKASADSCWKKIPADLAKIYYGTNQEDGVAIGTSTYGSNTSRLLLNTANSSQNQIIFQQGGTTYGKLALDSAHNVGLGNVTLAAANSTALGATVTASGANSTALGYGASATQALDIAIGSSANAAGSTFTFFGSPVIGGATALGASATAETWATSIGASTNASGWASSTFGVFAKASGQSSTSIGASANTSADGSSALGNGANASGVNSSALGSYTNASGANSTALGHSANVSGANSTAIGDGASSAGPYNIAIGHSANATNGVGGCTTVGGNAKAIQWVATALGYGANSSYVGSTAIGYNATTTANNQIMMGTSNEQVYFPGTIAAPSDFRLKNIKGEYNKGIVDIRKIKTYNYTFKNDKRKTPRVGVIAQDIQKILPQAITKDNDGYLAVKQEDLFYAMMNAIKQLDKMFEALINVNSITNQKIKILEAENKSLKKQNKAFENRLTKLEKGIK